MSAAAALQSLRANGGTLATAESLTGGLLAVQITTIPGASECFVGGVVAYDTSLKASLLGVPTPLLDQQGAVSEQCAAAMATGVRRQTGATWGLSTTGVAGPGTVEGQPVGTVFVGVAGPDFSQVLRLSLAGDRDQIRVATCSAAWELLLDALTGVGPEQVD